MKNHQKPTATIALFCHQAKSQTFLAGKFGINFIKDLAKYCLKFCLTLKNNKFNFGLRVTPQTIDFAQTLSACVYGKIQRKAKKTSKAIKAMKSVALSTIHFIWWLVASCHHFIWWLVASCRHFIWWLVASCRHRHANIASPVQASLLGTFVVFFATATAFAAQIHNLDGEEVAITITENGIRSDFALPPNEAIEICENGCFVLFPASTMLFLDGSETIDIENGEARVK